MGKIEDLVLQARSHAEGLDKLAAQLSQITDDVCDSLAASKAIITKLCDILVTDGPTLQSATKVANSTATEGTKLLAVSGRFRLPSRICDALAKTGVHTVDDLLRMEPGELSHIKGIGENSVITIYEWLQGNGLLLRRNQ